MRVPMRASALPAILALSAAAAMPAAASLTEFASFQELAPWMNLVKYGSNAGQIKYIHPNHNIADDVLFTFTSGALAGQSVDARVLFTASTNGTTSVANGSVSQHFSDVSMQFIAIDPNFIKAHGGNTDLLTISSSTGNLGGKLGGTSAVLGGSTAYGDIVDFSSQFESFGSGSQAYQLNLAYLTPSLAAYKSGGLKAFTASASGQFFAEPVPEASTALSFAGLLTVGLLRTRRRRFPVR